MELVVKCAALEKREIPTPAVTVETIRGTPHLQESLVVPNPEAALRLLVNGRLLAQVLDHLVHES
jgi:hypothetical protein